MKLAEALISRADLQKRLAQLQARIVENARVQEGDAPSEDPNRLLEEYQGIVRHLVDLISRVNRTNLSVELSSGKSLTESIAERDGLKLQAQILRTAADAGAGKQTRVTRTEVKFVTIVNVGQLREEADRISKRFRELDSEVQAANWNNDLLE